MYICKYILTYACVHSGIAYLMFRGRGMWGSVRITPTYLPVIRAFCDEDLLFKVQVFWDVTTSQQLNSY